jgi:hypothetical protein
MDAVRFDNLTRLIGTGITRRTTLLLLAGLGVQGHGLSDPAAARSRRGCRRCDECESCRRGRCHKSASDEKRCSRGRCRPKANGTSCSGGGTCQNGRCRCASGMSRCGGVCVNLQTDPRNCGSCGARCQLFAACSAGTCDCVPSSCALVPNSICCGGAGGCAACSATDFVDPRDCSTGDTTPCIGPSCRSCCPAGSTCDSATGKCVQ